jgi:hypothetical protein
MHFLFHKKQYEVLWFNPNKLEGSFECPLILQQNTVQDNRFFHGGQANATSSSYLKHDVLLLFLGCKVL